MLKVKPGVSSYTTDPAQAGLSLRPLMAFGKSLLQKLGVREKLWGEFPVFFKATAGLPELNSNGEREAILQQIRGFLSNKTECPFYFQWWQAR